MAELTRTWTTDRDQIKPPYLIMKDNNLVLLLNPNHHCCLFWRRMGKGGGPSWASGRIGVSTRIIGRWDGAGRGLEMDGKFCQIPQKSALAVVKYAELGEREVFVIGSSRCDYRCFYGSRVVDKEAFQQRETYQW